ncbi:hypothetical protein FOMG_16866 [Fusarium oxysporum f. sp. melonis 26406]|uniref:C2H2-type domain-containing protein n=2 Tax=Fusarium oxysporum TaxID=5507 RepID=A0A2H3G993_FUSOX|nr:hypothetical protein FOMG_16866 [Fusarium oxysporum f. sp. melonis 26406]PCD22213.1 hypothetical protein AU210_016005 [Fusarium oxysporum f. sp. radicis-cucumerinum]
MNLRSLELTPARPDLNPSRSPFPDIPKSQIGLYDTRQPIGGAGMLPWHLGDGRNLEALETPQENLLCDEDSPGKEPRREWAADGNIMSGPLLQRLATDALQAASIMKSLPSLAASIPTKIRDKSTATRRCSDHVEPPIDTQSKLRYSRQRTPLPNKPQRRLRHEACTPAGESKETLPPQSLPSLRSTFGELRDVHLERPSEQDLDRVPPGLSSTFPTSPVANLGHGSSLNTSLPLSPRSLLGGYRTLSLHSATSASSPSYPVNNGYSSDPAEHSSSNAGETPNANHSISTPGRSASISSSSIPDHMSIDGVANPEHISASYRCTHSGCNAGPFRRPFELTSHMTVHSSERLYYCQVQGCSRREAGKGFKRKNELKRHGSTHNPPGYCCPFCPVGRVKRKYPRPDNLTRHVRGQHKDKDEDDPQLRNVLAQRPDGPNRQRRRRGRRS